MKVENFSFKNGHNLKIVGEVWHPENPKGLAIVQHGLSGDKQQPHIQSMAKVLHENGYTTVLFDATHSWGNSDGKLSGITLTSHWEDLEDTIGWAKLQPFYKEPFILAGHSLGAFSSLYMTQKYPDKVKAVFPASAFLSGKLRVEAYEKYSPNELSSWKQKGFKEKQHRHKPDIKDVIPYGFMQDCMRYDVLKDAHKITCPTLLMVGEKDISTPPEQQRLLKDTLGGPSEFIVIPNCEHTFRETHELDALESAMTEWLKTV